MNKVLGDLEDRGVKSYFDDILIFNKSKKERFELNKLDFERLRNFRVTISPDKTRFLQKENKILGIYYEWR